MKGQVIGSREAVLRLELVGTNATTLDVQVVFDSGFTEHLCLPATVISSLALPFRRTEVMRMADGSSVALRVFQGYVNWDGVTRRIPIQEGGDESLAGMALVKGCRVVMDVLDGGDVTITPLA